MFWILDCQHRRCYKSWPLWQSRWSQPIMTLTTLMHHKNRTSRHGPLQCTRLWLWLHNALTVKCLRQWSHTSPLRCTWAEPQKSATKWKSVFKIVNILDMRSFVSSISKGSFQKRFSGFCPLRGYRRPPYPLNGKSVWKKKDFFLNGKGGYPPPLNGQNPLKRFWQFP